MYRLRYYPERKKGEIARKKVFHASTINALHEWIKNNIPIDETGVMAIFNGPDLIDIYQPIGGILARTDGKSFPNRSNEPWKLYRKAGETELGDRLIFVRSFPHFEDVQVWLNLERSFQPQIRHEVFYVYSERTFIAWFRCERFFRAFFPDI